MSKTSKEKMKLSFHVPASEHHVIKLIEAAADSAGVSPSAWVYGTVVKRLQEAGLLDKKREILTSEYKALLESLPPAKRSKYAEDRSKTDS